MRGILPDMVTADESLITCRLSGWFFRRLGMLMVLTGGLSLYFLYDGWIGYPRKNDVADLHQAFESAGKGIDWQPPDDSAKRTQQQTDELEAARQAARDGATWAGFAAERMLPEKEPKRYSREEIKGQFRFAVLLGVITLAIGGWGLLQRRRSFQADRESMVFPGGKRVRFSDIRVIDLRKWDRGVARLTYADESGEGRAAKVDDYKFAGTDAILRRACEINEAITIEGDRRWLTRVDSAGKGTEDGH